MYKLGFRSDPDANQYEGFNKDLHIKSSLSFNSGDDPDLSPYSIKRYDQRATNACVAFAWKQALEIKYCMVHGIQNSIELSVLDIYYGARDLMDPKETDKDDGTFVTLAAESLKRFGVSRDIMNPFKEENLFIPPPVLADREAYLNKIDQHFRIASSGRDRVSDMIVNLQLGNPIVAGTTVDLSKWRYHDGQSPLDTPKKVDGLHGICIVGYSTSLDAFRFANSWGLSWGLNGFGMIKADIIGDPTLTQDCWIAVNSTDAWFEKR